MYETKAGIPSRSETYLRLIDHLRECQDCSAMLAHLSNTESGPHAAAQARGWLVIEEQMKKMVHICTELAKGTLS